jgi:hypothetical protein
MTCTSKAPCATCPWRVASDPADIPGFSIQMARDLRSTVGEGDGFRQVMACHYSGLGAEAPMMPCRGYLARHGWSNINVRIMVSRHGLDLRAIEAACAGMELYADFDAMLYALERKMAPRLESALDQLPLFSGCDHLIADVESLDLERDT